MWGSLAGRNLRSWYGRGAHFSAAIGLGAGLVFVCALPASAQIAPEYHFTPDIFEDEVPRGETVRTRARPELDALGLHVGSFYIFPSLTNGISYNDNVFATRNDEQGDFLYTLRPQIAARSDWNQHAVGLSAGGDLGFYFDETDENYKDAFATATGKLDISSSSVLRGEVNLRRDHEVRGDPNDTGGTEPTVFYTYAGQVDGSHRFNRLTLSAGGEVRRLEFDDVETAMGSVDQSHRDRVLYRPGVRAAYEFHPGYSAFTRAEGKIVRYDEAFDPNGFKRDSQGYDVVGGAAIDLTGLLFGDFFAGIRQRYFEDSRFDTVTGPVVGATMTWIPTGLTTVILKVNSEIIESTDADTSSYQSTGLALTVDHELLRNLILTAGGGFRYDDFEGVSRTDKFFTGIVGASYLWNRYLSLTARYIYSHRDSDEASAEYTRNLISLLLTAKL